MKKIPVQLLLVMVVLLSIYGRWLTSHQSLTGGDWPFLYPEGMSSFSLLPQNFRVYIGLGQSTLLLAPIEWYFQASARIGSPLGWPVVERLFWFFPIVVLSVWSSYRLTRSWIGVLIYTTNTYILMLIGGGQLGVALAYAVFPFIVHSWIPIVRNAFSPTRTVLFSCLVALIIAFDLRIAYVAGVFCGLVAVWEVRSIGTIAKLVKKSSIVGGIALGLHAFWIVPLFTQGVQSTLSSLDDVYTSIDALTYFSVARFPQTFSLLHPNWPENIFGKVYLMQAEFLLIPIVSFLSLYFISNRNSQTSKSNMLFALIGVTGAFLAKGVNEPFGYIYQFLFEQVPGFVMFRDPTKWYVLVALSYSVLIPVSLSSIASWIHSKFNIQIERRRRQTKTVITTVFIVLWIVLIREAWMGNLTGTFVPKDVPKEYVKLKDYIHNQHVYSRTFWIPQKQRFGYFSNAHPFINATDMLHVTDLSTIVAWISLPDAHKQLLSWGVSDVIVPLDSEKELFLKERLYCDSCRNDLIEVLNTIPWLSRVADMPGNAVYQVYGFDELSIPDMHGKSGVFTTQQTDRLGLFISGISAIYVILFLLYYRGSPRIGATTQLNL